MGIHATLMLAPGCSPWRPKSELTTSPDAVTDGGGGADLRRARTRRSGGQSKSSRIQSEPHPNGRSVAPVCQSEETRTVPPMKPSLALTASRSPPAGRPGRGQARPPGVHRQCADRGLTRQPDRAGRPPRHVPQTFPERERNRRCAGGGAAAPQRSARRTSPGKRARLCLLRAMSTGTDAVLCVAVRSGGVSRWASDWLAPSRCGGCGQEVA